MNTGTALLIENMRETCSKNLKELGKNIPVYGMIDQDPSYEQVLFWMGGDAHAAQQFQAYTRLLRHLDEVLLIHNEIMNLSQE